MIPSSSPIALNTFKISSSDAPVKSSGNITSSSSTPRSKPSSSESLSINIVSNSISSSSPVTSSDSSSVSSISSSILPCSVIADSFFFSELLISIPSSTSFSRDSFTNSLISSFIVEASIPFAFCVTASSKFFICSNASSTKDFSL